MHGWPARRTDRGELYRTENAGAGWTKMNAAEDDLTPKGSGLSAQR
jgi:hypothetical protein